jgi:polar amino acid transport system substrate-binding protein
MGRLSWFLVLALAWALPGFAQAQRLRVGLREVPPYVYRDSSGTLIGLEYDIVTQALIREGFEPEVQTFPFSRMVVTYQRGDVDVVAPALSALRLDAEFSDPYLAYHNVAMSLASRELDVRSIRDIAGLRVMAFQNARALLDPAFGAMVDALPSYEEQPDQRLQVNMLLTGRTDLVIAERRILRYFIANPLPELRNAPALAEHPIFPPILYRVAFREPSLVAHFNRGLAALKADGTYDRLIQRYDAALPSVP